MVLDDRNEVRVRVLHATKVDALLSSALHSKVSPPLAKTQTVEDFGTGEEDPENVIGLCINLGTTGVYVDNYKLIYYKMNCMKMPIVYLYDLF